MRRLMIVMAAAAIVGGGVWVAQAGTPGGTTPVRCMDTAWRRSAVSTSSTTFAKVPGLGDSPASIDPIAINVSALVSGAPVEFRVVSTDVGAQTSVSAPGRTRFVPSAGDPDSFSFQWIEPNQSAAVHVNDLRLEWRSPSGVAVRLIRGDMSVLYDTEPGACAAP
jgi:hypothetical protein